MSRNYNISSYSTLEICLFGAVGLTRNADFDTKNTKNILDMELDLIDMDFFFSS